MAILAWGLIAELIAADIVKGIQGSTAGILAGILIGCTVLTGSSILVTPVLALYACIVLSLIIGLSYLLVPVAGAVVGTILAYSTLLGGSIILHLLLAILAWGLIAELIAADIVKGIQGSTAGILAGILIGCTVLTGSSILVTPVLALYTCIVLSLVIGLSYISILIT